ncbi:MBL fold metallo-hydrolase [Longibaculum muris]|uniref:MBL fold metallo-hydrolase n=1 Tax=Longibaculum muris TaxID=1796628 RepID=UPI0012B7BA73|nr:MBL fold metallo-hydrolase [Longibaculum muris]
MIKKLILGSMQTNCYVVYNEQKECLVIDPGANGQKVLKYLRDNELNLQAILLTHGHFDHIGAVDYLYERLQCPIYTHQETFPLLKDQRLNLSIYEEPFIVKAPILAAMDEMKIADFDIEWLLLEGHCQGSSMIYIKNENALFSGDVLFAGSVGRFDFPTSSHLQTKESMEKIKALAFDARLLPGHGEESTLSFEQQNNPYLRSY